MEKEIADLKVFENEKDELTKTLRANINEFKKSHLDEIAVLKSQIESDSDSDDSEKEKIKKENETLSLEITQLKSENDNFKKSE